MTYNGLITTSHLACTGVKTVQIGTVVNGVVNSLDTNSGVYNFTVLNDAVVAYFVVKFLCDGIVVSQAVMVFEDNLTATPTYVHNDNLPTSLFACSGIKTIQTIAGSEVNGTVNAVSATAYTFTTIDPTQRSGFDAIVLCDGLEVGRLFIIIPDGDIPPTPITSTLPAIEALDSRIFRKLWLSRNDISHNVDAETYSNSRSDLRYFLEILGPPYPLASMLAAITEPLDMAENPPYQVGNITTLEGAIYRIEQYLDDELVWTRPDFEQRGFKTYYRHTMPFQLRSTVKPTNTTETTDTEWVFKGGIDDEDFRDYGLTFFDQYLANTRQFLTWCPNDKLVSADQPEFLYFLLNFEPLPTVLRLRVRVSYIDNTFQILTPFSTKLLPALRLYNVVSVAVGHDALGLGSLTQKVHKWEVWLDDQTGVRVSEIRAYRQDFEYRHQSRYVIFSNSLGGYDTYRFYGTSSQKLSTRRTTYRRNKSFWDDPSLPEILVNEVESERSLTAYTGWLDRRTSLKWLQELALSEDVYLHTDRLLRPMMVVSSELVYDQDEERRIGRVFDFSFVNRHNNYSNLPEALTIVPRPTAWRGSGVSVCELDAFYKRTGKSIFTRLEKYYTDDSSIVKPKQFKSNDPGDSDYIPPIYVSGQCTQAASSSYHLNSLLSQLGTFTRANCPVGQTGVAATITIPADRWGGIDPVTGQDTQAKADARALAEYNSLNTQSYADANGVCMIFYQKIEAEDPNNLRFNVSPMPFVGASGGMVMAFIGAPDKGLTFYTILPVAKLYTVKLYYSYYGDPNSGMPPTSQATLSIDGGTPMVVTFGSAQNTIQNVAFAPVAMSAGAHSLYFSHSGTPGNAFYLPDFIEIT